MPKVKNADLDDFTDGEAYAVERYMIINDVLSYKQFAVLADVLYQTFITIMRKANKEKSVKVHRDTKEKILLQLRVRLKASDVFRQ